MLRFKNTLTAMLFVSISAGSLRAAEPDPKDLVEQGIKALGGEEKLSKAAAFQWKVDGKISFGGNESPFTGGSLVKGIDHLRSDFEGDFGGNKFKAATVIAGDKGWGRFSETTMELDKDALANEKRNLYLQVVPATLLPLKTKAFQIASVKSETVAGKDAAGIKVTGPDGKDFQLYFDKESRLPVRQVAEVQGFNGEKFTQETTFEKYKAFDGIQKATHIENKRDGEKFVVIDVTEFKALSKVDGDEFSEPK